MLQSFSEQKRKKLGEKVYKEEHHFADDVELKIRNVKLSS